jgi:hypothetical protein
MKHWDFAAIHNAIQSAGGPRDADSLAVASRLHGNGNGAKSLTSPLLVVRPEVDHADLVNVGTHDRDEILVGRVRQIGVAVGL